MKKILGRSLVAMMAVTTANAEIASKAYVDVAANGTYGIVNEDNTTGQNIAALDAAIGTPTSGKTIVQMIGEVETAASGDADAIETKLGAGAEGYDIDAKSLQIQGEDVQTELIGSAPEGNADSVDKNKIVIVGDDGKFDVGNYTLGAAAAESLASGVTNGGTGLTNSDQVYDAIQDNAIQTVVAGDSGVGTIKVDGTTVTVYGLGTAAGAAVSTNGVAASESGLVTGDQVNTAISNLNSGGTYEVTAHKSNAAAATTDLADNDKKDAYYPTLAGAKAIADAEIADLDATESQTAGADGLALSITEVDGVITSISGSIASGTYAPANVLTGVNSEADSNAATGNVVTGVSQTDGVVTVSKGNAIMETSATTSAGVDVLVRTGSGTAQDPYVYAWESIARP